MMQNVVSVSGKSVKEKMQQIVFTNKNLKEFKKIAKEGGFLC